MALGSFIELASRDLTACGDLPKCFWWLEVPPTYFERQIAPLRAEGLSSALI